MPNRIGHEAHHPIAGFATTRIVMSLQAVDVDHQTGERVMVALARLNSSLNREWR